MPHSPATTVQKPKTPSLESAEAKDTGVPAGERKRFSNSQGICSPRESVSPRLANVPMDETQFKNILSETVGEVFKSCVETTIVTLLHSIGEELQQLRHQLLQRRPSADSGIRPSHDEKGVNQSSRGSNIRPDQRSAKNFHSRPASAASGLKLVVRNDRFDELMPQARSITNISELDIGVSRAGSAEEFAAYALENQADKRTLPHEAGADKSAWAGNQKPKRVATDLKDLESMLADKILADNMGNCLEKRTDSFLGVPPQRTDTVGSTNKFLGVTKGVTTLTRPMPGANQPASRKKSKESTGSQESTASRNRRLAMESSASHCQPTVTLYKPNGISSGTVHQVANGSDARSDLNGGTQKAQVVGKLIKETKRARSPCVNGRDGPGNTVSTVNGDTARYDADDESESMEDYDGSEYGSSSQSALSDEYDSMDRHRQNSLEGSVNVNRPRRLSSSGKKSTITLRSKLKKQSIMTLEESRQMREKELTDGAHMQVISRLFRETSPEDCFSDGERGWNDPDFLPGSGNALLQDFRTDKYEAWVLKAFGVQVWGEKIGRTTTHSWWAPSRIYQFLIILLAAAAAFVQGVAVSMGPNLDDHTMGMFGRMSDFTLGLGTVLGLLGLRAWQDNSDFSDCQRLLLGCAHDQGFLDRWSTLSRRDIQISAATWCGALVARIFDNAFFGLWPMQKEDGSFDTQAAVGLVAFMFAVAAALALATGILHVSRAVTSMIDNYCCKFIEEPDTARAVREWNVLQAVLRKSCSAVQHCFVALQTTVTAAMLLSIVDLGVIHDSGYRRTSALPHAIVMAGIGRLFVICATVTERCARVPAFMNSLSFGTDLDTERLYLVEYIAHSAAGFYVFDVRLTAAMALKFSYLCCVVAFAVATNMLASSTS